MIRRKSSAIVLSALGIVLTSSSVCAAAPVTAMQANNFAVTLPQVQPGYTFTFAALALKPGATNLNYVIYNRAGDPTQTPIWQEQELRPSYSFAFDIGAGYAYAGGGEVNIDWTHLNSNTTASVSAPNSAYFLGPDYEIGPDGLLIRSASGKVEFRYDVINLDFAQRAEFGQHVDARFFIGLSNANLRERIISFYAGNVTPGNSNPSNPRIDLGYFNTEQTINANFFGVGPRAGFDMTYNADNGFSVMGEGAISALIGSSLAKTEFNSNSQTYQNTFNNPTNYQTIADENVIQVIPAVDGKVGINYNKTYKQGVLLTVGLGYEAAVYINAINQYLPGTLVKLNNTPEGIETGGIFVNTMAHTLSNYSVQGPFLRATVKF